jgi:hypothetical protein
MRRRDFGGRPRPTFGPANGPTGPEEGPNGGLATLGQDPVCLLIRLAWKPAGPGPPVYLACARRSDDTEAISSEAPDTA